MQPTEFLQLAEELHKKTGEAEWRTAVSRSYYAVFNELVEMLSSGGIQLQRNGKDHGRVAHYFASCGDRHVAAVSSWLNTLRISRNEADYDMRIAVDEKQSEQALETAKRVFVRVNNIDPAQRPRLFARMKATPLPAPLKP